MKKYRIKKGFTLIELLAVIVILAIIALIATPLVLSTIEKARMGAFRANGENLIRTAEQEFMLKRVSNNITDDSYEFKDGKMEGNILPFKGQNPRNGKIAVNEDGKVAIAIENGQYCAKKDYNESVLKVEKLTSEGCSLEDIDLISCFTFDDATSTITNYDEMCVKDVKIPSYIRGKAVKVIGEKAFDGKELTNVVIPNTVEIIGERAFLDTRVKKLLFRIV